MVVYYVTGLLFSIYAALRYKCDLIHVHWAIPPGLIAVLVGALLRKPLVVTVHGSDLRLATTGLPFLSKIFRSGGRRSSHVHSVSEGMQRNREAGIPSGKISVWPMGIDEEFLRTGRGEQRDRRTNG